MEMNGDDAGGGGQSGNPNSHFNPSQNPNRNPPLGSKGKSCKGCLYYSAVQKSKSKNPTCVGLSKTIQTVPSYIVGETEGRSLKDFKYACLGYSVYIDNKDSSVDQQDKSTRLPFCVGLEILSHVPAPASGDKNNEHEHSIPQPRRYNPPHTTGEVYLNRFIKSATLVASGVVRNMNILGNYVKETLGDILYPYRKRPK